MIHARDISKSYADAPILKNVSVQIPKGGLTAIIGANGTGKSTLLSIISRLLPMDAGSVSVDGLDVTCSDSRELAQRLSILRQDNHMTARITVRDLVSFGRYPYSQGRLRQADQAHIDAALGHMDLTDLQDRFLDQLSGGQRQRAFAAMVLCQDTDYILLDEPLNNLDMKNARTMMQSLSRMCRELGKTVVVVLHDINFASWYCDNIIALKGGDICCTGPTEQIMTSDCLRQIYDMEIEIVETGGKRTALYYG
ncbi:MAG: ATP-binding cassette domain-containing protein [Paracoccus sp. (in: a-proteobacteria)]|uniref:iron ABC transporter ATP-binding protein n=1 Tax=Paracoccus sp. TaxID=267 RepID=UPI0026DF7D33|nr:ATP-binding cassette domain-containing protein [Paracoccus sp. (in: a-proteobacteria)]MDO5621041.1 ATP-binding cassette domain-containing protein [Paracoccus sp. (in: a-proteobacteria)]